MEKKRGTEVIALLGMLNEVTYIKHLAVSQTRKAADSLLNHIFEPEFYKGYTNF